MKPAEGNYLTPCRKVGSKVAHWFTDEGKSLCGLTLGLERDWPISTDTYRCRKCEAARDKRRGVTLA